MKTMLKITKWPCEAPTGWSKEDIVILYIKKKKKEEKKNNLTLKLPEGWRQWIEFLGSQAFLLALWDQHYLLHQGLPEKEKKWNMLFEGIAFPRVL